LLRVLHHLGVRLLGLHLGLGGLRLGFLVLFFSLLHRFVSLLLFDLALLLLDLLLLLLLVLLFLLFRFLSGVVDRIGGVVRRNIVATGVIPGSGRWCIGSRSSRRRGARRRRVIHISPHRRATSPLIIRIMQTRIRRVTGAPIFVIMLLLNIFRVRSLFIWVGSYQWVEAVVWIH
jgi:hypothetical protein